MLCLAVPLSPGGHRAVRGHLFVLSQDLQQQWFLTGWGESLLRNVRAAFFPPLNPAGRRAGSCSLHSLHLTPCTAFQGDHQVCLAVPREPPEVPAPLPWAGSAAVLVHLAGFPPPVCWWERRCPVPMGSQAVVFIFLE